METDKIDKKEQCKHCKYFTPNAQNTKTGLCATFQLHTLFDSICKKFSITDFAKKKFEEKQNGK